MDQLTCVCYLPRGSGFYLTRKQIDTFIILLFQQLFSEFLLHLPFTNEVETGKIEKQD